MAEIQLKHLTNIRQKHKGKKIVFCSGTFDLFHAGHVLFLEDCKKIGDIVVVGLGSNRAIQNYKNHGPVLNEHLRLKILDSVRLVDYVFIDNTKNILELLKKTFFKLAPDYYVVNTDAKLILEREAIAKNHDVKMIILDRVCPPEYENISTTKIIAKIKKRK